MLKVVAPSLMKGWPNTYTFTKALAENLLVEEKGCLPLAIVRPSIVTSAWNEPLPGWIDNLNGPTGIFVGTYKGILRHIVAKTEACADVIPVDAVINLMIALVWFTSIKRSNTVQFYNSTSGAVKPLKWVQIKEDFCRVIYANPCSQLFRYPNISMTEFRLMNRIWRVIDHLLPGYLFDLVMTVLCQKPFMVKLYGKIHQKLDLLEPFTTNEWHFPSDNVVELIDQLQETDKDVGLLLFHDR